MRNAAIALLLVALALMTQDTAAQPQPTPTPNCKKTDVAGKCGTDRNENPTNCGGTTCYELSFIYGNITNCIGGGSGGRKNCCEGNCKETKITRTCEGGLCRVADMVQSDVLPTSHACGPACGNEGENETEIDPEPVP